MFKQNENDLSGMKVLIVDDTPANIDLLGHILKNQGLSISVAPRAKLAQEIIEKDKPDLILLDILMPEMDGYQFCEILKSNDQTKDIPVIFLTALSDSENVVKGFQVGAIDYITKPFKEEEVICRANSQLKLKKTQNELAKKQKELAQSEKLHRSIVEKVPELIFQLDPDRNIIFANHAFSRLGFEPDDLVGKPIIEFIASENKEELIEEIATRNVDPLAPVDISVEFKVNSDSTIFEQMQTIKALISSAGMWNVSDEEVFKKDINKEFLGTLCVGKI